VKKEKQLAARTTATPYDGAALFDSLASVYDEWFERDGELIFANEVRAFQQILYSLPKPWIEIGAGGGRFAHGLGIEIGLDPSIKLLELAGRRGITAFLGRGELQPFNTASFGTAFFIVTICFVQSPLDVLNETWRILAPDGKVVLGLVPKTSPWGRFYEKKKRQQHRFYGHATFYTYNDIVQLLHEAGFLVEKVVSTLFQKPGKVQHAELPQEGFLNDAGFVIFVAQKSVRV
jgi:SAM-dependent methyltransferase